jgi:hypothetical protein
MKKDHSSKQRRRLEFYYFTDTTNSEHCVEQATKEGHFVEQTADMHKQAVLLLCCITLVMCVVAFP